MLERKITRKDFLLTALSITAIFIGSKIPSGFKNEFSLTKKEKNAYGNSSYGGKKIS